MSDFDFSNAFEVHEFDYHGKTVYLRECPAGEFIANRTDLMKRSKGSDEREFDIDEGQRVRYDNAAKSICDPSGEVIFKTGAEVKAKCPAKLFSFVVKKMDEINGNVQKAEDEGNSTG